MDPARQLTRRPIAAQRKLAGTTPMALDENREGSRMTTQMSS
jgi:hypothetical protein